MAYKLGSLFDGSGGFPLAGSLCGVEPMWAAEVEPYPIAVTRSRFPNMKHLGDISKVNGGEIEPVDIITFGSPCQDLSVAGKRAGLKHEANGDEETTRSGLFMEAVRIIKEMREATNGEYPSFALWENVPGAFSSNKGEDFRLVCEELIKIVEPTAAMPAVPKNGWPYADSYCGDGWSLAYRVFDAQYWGVPQRRRRIHLVLDLRGERARQVSFEREGVRGYFETGRTPWQILATHAQNGLGADDREGEGFDGYNGDLTGEVSATLGVNCGDSTGRNGVIERRGDGGLDAVVFDGANVTSPINASNPQPGDPCHTLSTDSRNYVVSPVPYTLKIRSGVAVDSNGKAAGKGALVQVDKAATLAVTQDQYLFQPVAFAQNQRDEVRDLGDKAGALQAQPGMKQQTFIIDSVGGQAERGWESEIAPCLKATHYKMPPVVTAPTVVESAAGFCTEHSAKARGVGFQEECAPTLRAGVTPACVYEPKVSIGLNGGQVAPTLISRMSSAVGTTQDNLIVCEPMLASGNDVAGCLMASGYEKLGAQEMFSGDYTVVEKESVFCLQGNGIDRADTAGCNGKGWKEDTSYTLNTIDRPAVVYALDRASFNQGKNAKYNFQITEDGINSTLTAQGPSAVCCTTGSYMQTTEEVSPTLMARDWKDPACVCANYIVRRLTPTECARLQGFADRWGDIDEKETLTPEEFKFWHEVRNTHAAINGKKVMEYTEAQMLTWYNKLHTDSAEYKMWGNGIALPPALYILQGMVEVLNNPKEKDEDEWMS